MSKIDLFKCSQCGRRIAFRESFITGRDLVVCATCQNNQKKEKGKEEKAHGRVERRK